MRYSRGFAVTAIFLSACSWGGSSSPLPPEEVLQNTARASQSLDSANYVLDGQYAIHADSLQVSSGNVHTEGTVSHGGEQLQFLFTVNGDVTQGEQKSTLSGTLEVIVAGAQAVYMKLHALNVQPSNDIFRPDLVGQFAGKWWILPSDTQTVGTVNVTPDPKVLQAQSQVVRVVEDDGLRELNGRQVYFYKVELDQQKLLAYLETLAQQKGEPFDKASMQETVSHITGEGELWIDAETFQLHKVTWDLKNVPLNTIGHIDVSVTVNFSNHNAAAPITIPTDAEMLSPAALLGVPPPQYPEQVLPGAPPELEQEMIDELLHNMQTQ